MADVWQSLTLGDVFSGLNQGLGDIQAQANDLFNKYSAVVSQMNAKVNALQSILNTTSNLLSKLQASGLYVCYLAPAQGGWATRLQNATGAPPNDGYSAGICVIAQGVDLSTVSQQYQNLMDVLTTPVQVP